MSILQHYVYLRNHREPEKAVIPMAKNRPQRIVLPKSQTAKDGEKAQLAYYVKLGLSPRPQSNAECHGQTQTNPNENLENSKRKDMIMATAKISPRSNCQVEQSGGYMTIRVCVDPAKVTPELSKSGKTYLVATTGGAIRFADGVQVSVNIYRKNPDYVKPA